LVLDGGVEGDAYANVTTPLWVAPRRVLGGQIPVSASLRYFRELDVKNRLEGDAGYANITIPLSVAGQ
jgi:hypothetical protein